MHSSKDLWLYHPHLLPDELLSHWLVRIAHGHDMKLQTFCRVALGKGQDIWMRDVDRQAPDWLVRALAEHTGAGVRRIRQASLLAYRGVLYRHYHWSGHQQWILPLHMVDTSFHHHGLQYCPVCLAKGKIPYFRRRWRVALYTMCTEHRCMLHDRCPSCGAPVAFHRREMGKFSIIDPGLVTQCHACDFDLRQSEIMEPAIYDESAYQTWLPALKLLEGDYVDARYNLGFLSVLHQLCKVMLSHYVHVHLREYVSEKIGAPDINIHKLHKSFEHYSVQERHIVIQLAMWLLANPEVRIVDAWRDKAVRYNILNKDFEPRPQWFKEIVIQCKNWRDVC